MSTNDFISNVTDCLASWGINYTETTDGLYVKSVTLTVSEDEPASTITDGDSLVAITSDAGKAAALLAFPLARRAWDAGYTGDFECDDWEAVVERSAHGLASVAATASLRSPPATPTMWR